MKRLTRKDIEKAMADDNKGIYFLTLDRFVNNVTPDEFATILSEEVYSPYLVKILLDMQIALIDHEYYEYCAKIRDFMAKHEEDILFY